LKTFPLSAINQFLYCPRRAYLIHMEGVFEDNEHTLLGDQAHEHVDFPGYEQRAGWTLLRALPVFSDTLGLSGKADLVEIHRDASGAIFDARPIEYKKGPKRKFTNDDAQLCAQALCLEEMFGINIPAGAIYHVKSERRAEVVFDETLRAKTHETIRRLHSLLSTEDVERTLSTGNAALPSAILRPQCDGCSLHEICLPEAAATRATKNLFEPRNYE